MTLRIEDAKASREIMAVVDQTRLIKFDKNSTAAPDVLWEAKGEVRAVRVACTSDAKRFALCVLQKSPRRHRIEVYEAGQSRPLWSIASNLANDMTFAPSGNLLAYVWNNDIVLLDVLTGEKTHLLSAHADSVQGLEFRPDGAQLASVSSDRQLMVWSVASGELLWSQQAHENRAMAVTYHPTLPTIATIGADAIVRFWSSRDPVADESVRLVGEFPLDVGECGAISFSATGKTLFVQHLKRGVTELRVGFE
jgi:WD40 repeat protein